MQFLKLIHFLDLIGSFVFAVSGALAGANKKMDILGMLVLAIVTAVGGGTLRSILIGDAPVPFLRDIAYFSVCLIATASAFFFRKTIQKLEKPILIFDALGLGIFMSTGMSVALNHGLSEWASLLMGIITASFGGVIRDVLCAEIPLIFHREIYATACLMGGVFFLVLKQINLEPEIVSLLSALLILCIRLLAVRFNLSLPKS